MRLPDHADPPQVKVSPETDSRVGGPVSQPVGEGSQGSGVGDQVVVLVELLRRIAPVSSEEPEAIMQLFVKLEEIHELGLVEDRVFLTRILPLVSGSLLGFVGDCLREGSCWMESKKRLLERYFPYFVRERLVRELIVFNFHEEGQSLRQYIDRIFRVVKFLDYRAGEEQLVERVIINFHSSILANTALMDRPRSLKDLYRMVGLVEERMAVGRERERESRRASSRAEPC
jgi:hypothetical protein